MLEMCRVVRGPVGPVAVFALALFAWAGSVHAQQPSQVQVNAIRQSCRSDYQSYCASVPAGGSAALNCLKENMQSLSGPCQQAVGAVAGAAPAARPASPGAAAPTATAPGATATAPVSPAAPAYQNPAPPMSPRQEAFLLRRACGPDYRAYCSYVEPGGGRIIECLRENAPSLSRQCRSALSSAMRSR